MTHGKRKLVPKVERVVMVLSDSKSRRTWLFAVVEEIYQGVNAVLPGVRVRTKNGGLDRPIQHSYPLETNCDRPQPGGKLLNIDSPEFVSREQLQ